VFEEEGVEVGLDAIEDGQKFFWSKTLSSKPCC
jgi:hypothetical protein